jgi:hypothetical protein
MKRSVLPLRRKRNSKMRLIPTLIGKRNNKNLVDKTPRISDNLKFKGSRSNGIRISYKNKKKRRDYLKLIKWSTEILRNSIRRKKSNV